MNESDNWTDIFEFCAESSQGTLKFRIMDFENGVMILISDSEKFKMGLSAVATPPGAGRNEPTSVGLLTLGLDATLVRTLAERLTKITGRACMVILSMSELDRVIIMEILSLLKDHFLT